MKRDRLERLGGNGDRGGNGADVGDVHRKRHLPQRGVRLRIRVPQSTLGV